MCPHAQHGSYKSRFKHPTLVSEAICDSDLRFTHIFTSQPGVMNDLNILVSSPFTHILHEKKLPEVQYDVCGEHFTHPYFFGDGIYPSWPVFLTAPRAPQTNGQKKFTKKQESVRKDIERAFGVLKCRFRVLKHGLFYRDLKKCDEVTQACFILHNLILEQRLGKDPVEELRRDKILQEGQLLDEFIEMELEDDVVLPHEEDQQLTSAENEFWYFSRQEHSRLRDAFYNKFS